MLELSRTNPDLIPLLDLLHVAIFTIDLDGGVTGWSAGAARITGLPAEQVLGKSVALLDTDDRRGLASVWQRLIEGEQAFVNDIVTLRHKDGHEVAMLGDLRPVERAGALVGVIGCLTLLEPHLRANQRLAQVVPPERTKRVFHQMVGESGAMREVFEELEQAASVDVTVLIRGETGTGKELAARAIHALSGRRGRPLVCVNCSAIPDPLLESELFGHVRGAFTGATRDKRGVFEEADGGVLFLDEIGDLGPSVQVKLLRALQEREIRRVGDTKTIRVDVRIVSATNRDLAAMVAAGQFREDLYYRIRVFELNLPPLRGRPSDVALLAEHFVESFNRLHKKQVAGLTEEARDCLGRYAWPGNVRELRNAIEHAFVTVKGDAAIGLKNLPVEIRRAAGATAPLSPGGDEGPLGGGDEVQERARIVSALREAGGKKSLAAGILGISRVTLWKKVKKYGINPVWRD
ncbi:MAG: sigma-54 interaction domain-containing protein [Planctomycetota bacterium]